MNPKDWEVAEGLVPGVRHPKKKKDDFSGVVHHVGNMKPKLKLAIESVYKQTLGLRGGWAEYAIAYESMAFYLADHISFEGLP